MMPLLSLNQVGIEAGGVALVESVTLDLAPGRVLGLVGESGSGKSLTVMSIPGLLPAGCTRSHGSIRLQGREIGNLPERELRQLRGSEIGVVFQDPFTSLNPVRTIGSLIEEAVRRHQGLAHREAQQAVVTALDEVGLPDPEAKARAYPHELSGGQRQRALIALAMVNRPRLLIADEPTTALDATVQIEILNLLNRSVRKAAGSAIFVTHDLGAAAYLCDEIAVMYAGRIVEHGPTAEIILRPQHPYTAALLACAPRIGGELVAAIPGHPPGPGGRGTGCAFAARCGRPVADCAGRRPVLLADDTGHASACLNPLPRQID